MDKPQTMHVVLILTLTFDWVIKKVDVNTTFLMVNLLLRFTWISLGVFRDS